MHCLDVQVELQAYIDKDLDSERVILVEQHLAGCKSCQSKLARLQAVITALETWPLVVEPADLTTNIMGRVRSRPTLPAFRLRWSDLAISLAGAMFLFVVMLAWYYQGSVVVTYLKHAPIDMWLERLWLETLLALKRLFGTDNVAWVLLPGGATLAIVLVIAAWNLTVWERETLSA
ncbi:MAG: hypothetical protein GY832_10455 [Chloroflexi bacterium]|nr:hypothetical protein [Chloroflexota bacterium]